MKKIIVVVVVLFFVVSAIYGVIHLKRRKHLKSIIDIPTATVLKGKFVDAIETFGKISSSEEKYIKTPRLKSDDRGELTIKPVLVKNEAEVKKDELLAEFDTTEIENNLKEKELELNKLKFDLDKAVKEVKIKEEEFNQQITFAESSLAVAKSNLLEYETITSRKMMENATLDLKEAEHSLKKAREELKQGKIMFKKGFISKSKFGEIKLDVAKAKSRLEIARLKKRLFTEYEYPSELANLKFEVQKAELNLKEAEFAKEIEVAKANAEIKKIEERIKEEEEKVKSMREDITLLKKGIVAPANGIIRYVTETVWVPCGYGGFCGHSPAIGLDAYQRGGKAGQGEVIFTMAELKEKKFSVKLELIEEDITKVKVGDKAIIKFEQFPNAVLNGVVSSVSDIPEYSWQERMNKYTAIVEIGEESINKAGITLKPGYDCKVEIVLKELKENTIYVPIDAVFEKDGKYVCYVEEKGKSSFGLFQTLFKEREVKIGLSTDKYVEILEGLKEGEKVYLEEPVTIEE